MDTEQAIDELRIEIQFEDNGAVSGLESITASLTRLKRISDNTKSLSGINESLARISGTATKDLSGLTESLESLSKTKISGVLASNLEKIASAAEKLNGVDFSGLKEMCEALSKVNANITVNIADRKAIGKVTDKAVSNSVDSDSAFSPVSYDVVDDMATGANGVDESGREFTRQDLHKISKAVSTVIAKFKELGNTISQTWKTSSTAAGVFKNVMSGVTQETTGGISAIVGAAEGLGGALMGSPVVALDGLKRGVSGLFSMLTGVVKQYTAIAGGVTRLSAALASVPYQIAKSGFGAIADSLASMASSVADKAVKNLPSAIMSVVHPIKTLNKTLKSTSTLLSQITGEMGDSVKSLGNFASTMLSSFKRIALYRVVRSIISSITSAFREGLENLYQYSLGKWSDFADSMDSLASSVLYLKNSFAAAASPIINALAPAIDYVIDKLVTLLNVFNQVMAYLTGATVWTKAIRYPTSYADAANGASSAANELRNTLLGFDEINRLDDLTDSGGGGSSGAQDYGSMFQIQELALDNSGILGSIVDFIDRIKEAAAAGDWDGVGKILAQGFGSAVDYLDEYVTSSKLKSKISDVVDAVTDVINGFFSEAIISRDGEETIAERFGKLVADGLNLAVSTINQFLKKVKWSKIGTAVGQFINKLTYTFDGATFSEAIANYLNAGINTAYGLVSTLNWSSLGDKIAETLNSFMGNLQIAKAASTLADTLTGLIQTAITTIKGIDFTQFGQKIGTALNTFLINYSLAEYGIGDLLAGAFNSAVSTIQGILDSNSIIHFAEVLAEDIKKFVETVDLKAAASALGDALCQLCDSAITIFGDEQTWENFGTKVAEGLKAFIQSGWLSKVGAVFGETLSSAVTSISAFAGQFTADDWTDLGKEIARTINDFMDKMTPEKWREFGIALNSLANGLLDALVVALDNVKWDEVANSIAEFLEGLDWKQIKTRLGPILGKAISEALQVAIGIPDVTSAISGIGNTLSSAFEKVVGSDCITGLKLGLAVDSKFLSWAKTNVVDPVVNFVKNLFGINSPSTVFEDIGKDCDLGLQNGLSNNISSVLSAAGGIVSGITSSIGGVVTSAFTWGRNTVSNLTSGLSNTSTVSTKASNLASAVKTPLSTLSTSATTYGTSTVSSLASGLSGTSNVSTKASSLASAVHSPLTGLGASANAYGTSTVSNLASGLSSTSSVSTQASAVKSAVTNQLSGISSSASTWGRDICSNLASGINSAVSKVTSAVSTVARKIKSLLGFSEPEEGPLSNFHTYMPDMLALMAKGIKENAYLATDAVSRLAETVAATVGSISQEDLSIPITASVAGADFSGAYSTAYSNSENADSGMIAALYAVGQQIVAAVQESGGDITLDGDIVARNVWKRTNTYTQRNGALPFMV